MSTSRILRIAAVTAAALVLVGCGRLQVELAVNENNTLDGTIVIAMLVGNDANAEQSALSVAEGIEEQLLPGLRDAPGVTHEEYAEEGYRGSRLILDATPLTALSGSDAFSLVRDGDVFRFMGTLDLMPDDEGASNDDGAASDDESKDVTIALRFPGAVTSHNGEVSGTTVTWSSEWSGKLDMRATAGAVPYYAVPWAWITAGLVVLLLIVAIVVGILVGRRRAGVPQAESVL